MASPFDDQTAKPNHASCLDKPVNRPGLIDWLRKLLLMIASFFFRTDDSQLSSVFWFRAPSESDLHLHSRTNDPPVQCNPTFEVQCRHSKKCVNINQLCDSIADCPFGSDEEQCECGPDEFRCRDRSCIGSQFKCDGVYHCRDGEFGSQLPRRSSCRKFATN